MPHRIPAGAYAIIIGAMKCGTTSLYNYLVCHAAICPSLDKEPEFFSEHQFKRDDAQWDLPITDPHLMGKWGFIGQSLVHTPPGPAVSELSVTRSDK